MSHLTGKKFLGLIFSGDYVEGETGVYANPGNPRHAKEIRFVGTLEHPWFEILDRDNMVSYINGRYVVLAIPSTSECGDNDKITPEMVSNHRE